MISKSYGSGVCRFQSTPLMRGETMLAPSCLYAHTISIHSPHARGDFLLLIIFIPSFYFNPLPSCEGRPYVNTADPNHDQFQSTPLMRGETRAAPNLASARSNFNPLPSCEGRLSKSSLSSARSISIHSPHARGDFSGQFLFPPDRFQSTPLMRGETA